MPSPGHWLARVSSPPRASMGLGGYSTALMSSWGGVHLFSFWQFLSLEVLRRKH